MPFDIISGLGRSPQVAGTRQNYPITDANFLTFDFANGLDQSFSTTIDSARLGYAIIFSASPRNTNGAAGTATLPKIIIKINDETIVNYTLTPLSGQSAQWRIEDIIPVNREFWGSGNNISVQFTASAVGGDGYGLYCSLSLATIRI